MKAVNEKWIVIIMLVILFGGIGVSKGFGIWFTESQKIPAVISEGEFAGENDPEDIRGSYALDDISLQFDIPVEVLKTAFMLPDSVDTALFKSKDLESYFAEDYEIGNDAMKGFVALYKGMPYETADLMLPESAVELILAKHTDLDDETYKAIEKTAVKVTPLAEAEGATTTDDTQNDADNDVQDEAQVEPSVEEDHDEPAINGYTTFADAVEVGIPEDYIEEVIGAPIPNRAMTIKLYCQNNGLAFSTVKSALTDYLENQ